MGAAIHGPDGRVDLGAEPLTIGRSSSNRMTLNNNQISGKHAEIQQVGEGRYQIVDIGSKNGTAVSGMKLVAGQPQPLNAGDVIVLGGINGVELRFELTPAAEALWQGNQQPMAGGPGGFGVSEPAQPFGGGIVQPPPGPSAFPPAPGFGPPGQPGPGAPPPFLPPQDAFPGAPGGFAPPPNQFGPPPGGPPPVGPNFPPPGGGSGTADFVAPGSLPPGGPNFPPPGGPGAPPFGPPAQGPNFPPPGGQQFAPPGGMPPPGGFPPPGGPGAPPFGGPGGLPPAGGPSYPPSPGFAPGGPGGQQYGPPPGGMAPGYAPPGGAPPAKKRGNRGILVLLGAIILLALIVGGIVFGVLPLLNKKTAPQTTPTPTPTHATRAEAQIWVAPNMVPWRVVPSASDADGQNTWYHIGIQ